MNFKYLHLFVLSHPYKFPDDPDVLCIPAPIINRCLADTGDF
jgi:hypothetical protein